MTFNEDQLVRMCRELDGVESELRHLERRLNHIRMKFREGVSAKRQHECGFVEMDDQPAQLMPRLNR